MRTPSPPPGTGDTRRTSASKPARRRTEKELTAPPGGQHASWWRGRHGLDLVSASLLPGRRELEVWFAAGPTCRVEVAKLGLDGPAQLAAVGKDPRVVVVGLADGDFVDVPSRAILALADPAYRAALTDRARSAGERVRVLRLAAGRRATEVAAAAGMARSNYARLEAGTHEPRLATLCRVAEVLGVPLGELVG
jgi:hypothetical protein